MSDYGLLVSIIVAFGVPSLVAWWWPIEGAARPIDDDDEAPPSFLDAALGPAFAGLAVGRLTTLALDDPNSMGSLSDILIIRSGVEFWPGVVAALGVALWAEHRAGVPRFNHVARLVPLAMVGYAAYEAACVFRDGCYGPASSIGLRPPGLSATMLPIGWLMACALLVAALGVRALAASGRPPNAVVAAGVAATATVRAIGSIWLPHVGEGLTRQHTASIIVAIAASAALVGTAWSARRSEATLPSG